MDADSLRVNNWLGGFYNFVSQRNPEVLGLYSSRIHFLPRQDTDNTIDVGLDDLHEPYTKPEIIKTMRQLFEEYAAEHKV